ncbi:MAG: hypothetical protein MZW92_42055 [Comamonadaceae bacterium]|nr:hypothetical protein [Comamonadaceae bacterium]
MSAGIAVAAAGFSLLVAGCAGPATAADAAASPSGASTPRCRHLRPTRRPILAQSRPAPAPAGDGFDGDCGPSGAGRAGRLRGPRRRRRVRRRRRRSPRAGHRSGCSSRWRRRARWRRCSGW